MPFCGRSGASGTRLAHISGQKGTTMDERPLAPGDVVCLKSGGPRMTLNWVEDGWAECVWLDLQGLRQRQQFGLHLLARAGDPW